jgi:hypothetical protein
MINCPTKYAIDIKVKIASVVADLRPKVGDNKSEVLASEASAINAMTTIMQTMNIILFDNIELDRLNDAFSSFLSLSRGRLIALVPSLYCEMTSGGIYPFPKINSRAMANISNIAQYSRETILNFFL